MPLPFPVVGFYTHAVTPTRDRFAQASLMSTLPTWVRPFINVFQQFGEAHGSLSRFFKRAASIPQLQVRHVPPPTAPSLGRSLSVVTNPHA